MTDRNKKVSIDILSTFLVMVDSIIGLIRYIEIFFENLVLNRVILEHDFIEIPDEERPIVATGVEQAVLLGEIEC